MCYIINTIKQRLIYMTEKQIYESNLKLILDGLKNGTSILNLLKTTCGNKHLKEFVDFINSLLPNYNSKDTNIIQYYTPKDNFVKFIYNIDNKIKFNIYIDEKQIYQLNLKLILEDLKNGMSIIDLMQKWQNIADSSNCSAVEYAYNNWLFVFRAFLISKHLKIPVNTIITSGILPPEWVELFKDPDILNKAQCLYGEIQEHLKIKFEKFFELWK